MRKILFTLLLLAMVAFPCFEGQAATKHAKKPVEPEVPSLVPAIEPIIATYDIYVGGLHLLTADILFEETGHDYHALFKAHTQGMWYHFVPWDTELDARGKIRSDQLVPVEYATYNVWGKKAKTMKLHFSPKNIVSEYDPPETDEKDVMTPEQKVGALDPVSALLQMLAHVSIARDCNVTVSVFDGKRRFDVAAVDTGKQFIDEEDYGVFKGEARTCDATFKAVSGEWTDKIKARFWKKAENGEDREPFHIWMAQIEPNLPELAVRLETGSAWGDVIVHLTKWRPATADDLAPKPHITELVAAPPAP